MGVDPSQTKMSFKQLLFGFKGRIKRSQFWLGTLVNIGMSQVIGTLGVLLAANVFESAGLFIAIIFLTYIPFLWISFALSTKRLHDHNIYGWLVIVPFYNIYLAVLTWFVKGDTGPNRFGPPPS